MKIHKILLITLICQAFSPYYAWAQSDDRASQGDGFNLGVTEVRGQRSLEDRFAAAGSRVVVTRSDVERMGADNIVDVLKQLPGVQVTGVGTGNVEIRMRGMDRNATQVLVDGDRVSGGRRAGQMPFDQLPADMIERIEVLRAPSAEHSGATGGTINIVMRDAQTKSEGSGRASLQYAFSDVTPGIWLHQTGPLNKPSRPEQKQDGDAVTASEPTTWGPGQYPWTYFIGAGYFERLPGSDLYRESGTVGETTGPSRTMETSRGSVKETMIMPRLKGRFSAQDQFALRATLLSSENRSSLASQTWSPSGNLAAQLQEQAGGDRHFASMQSEWSHRFDVVRVENKLSLDGGQENFQKTRAGTLVGVNAPIAQRFTDERRDRGAVFASKWIANDGELVTMGGVEFENRRLQVDNVTEGVNGVAATPRQLSSSFQRSVLWGQNEWSILSKTTLTTGLRLESIERSMSTDGLVTDDRRLQVQPSLHSRTRLSEALQFRLNLSRVTRLPALADMIERVNPGTGNSPTRPDTIGNAQLRPETTLSWDMGWDMKLASGGQAGVNLFVRRVTDQIVRRTSWVEGRWLQRPENVGSAWLTGIESDVKMEFDRQSWLGGWGLQANGSVLQSRLSSDNGVATGRLPNQAHYLLNVALSKPMPTRQGGFFGGASVNLVGAADLAHTDVSQGREHSTVGLETFVGQVIPGLGMWRLSVGNWLNSKKASQRVDLDGFGGQRYEHAWMRTSRRVFLSFGSRW